TDPAALGQLDLVKVLREGKTPLFAANLALAAYQRRLAEQMGVEPGAELKAAAADATAQGLSLELIDRDVGLTFKRAMQRLGWWGRAKVSASLLMGLLSSDEVGEDEIERLKQGDVLESSFTEFAGQTPELYETIIAERDRYMAARLREVPAGARDVLAVVGAGHLKGLALHLREDVTPPAQVRESLEEVKPKSRIPWMELVIATVVI